jgi:DNA polymerase-3 subunit alpha
MKLEGTIRSHGVHACGVVIAPDDLVKFMPLEVSAKGPLATQYPGPQVEELGLLKMDFLGLSNLSVIQQALRIIKKVHGKQIVMSEIPLDDDKVYDLFRRGDTTGVFQFESAGMKRYLRELQPTAFDDLIAMNALYRPGPMQFIDYYVKGKWDPSTIHYPDPCLEPLLKETNGVMVYQEQVMQVAQRIAGYSLGGADLLRRAMGKKIKEEMEKQLIIFEEGAVKQGFKKEHADEIFKIMEPFAGYGFNKSHAAAYSVLAYRTGWLKANRPAEYMAANLTNEITSTDKLPVYIEEARRLGIPIDAPDVNRSDAKFDVVDGHIVFGFEGIKGMGESAASAIVKEREENGPYKSFMDFLERVVKCKEEVNGLKKQLVNKKAIEVLIKTGGFDAFGINRPTLLENLPDAYQYATDKAEEALGGQLGLFDDFADELPESFTLRPLPDISNLEKLEMEK